MKLSPEIEAWILKSDPNRPDPFGDRKRMREELLARLKAAPGRTGDATGSPVASLGGPGSGNFGHAGRPGEVGGSAPAGSEGSGSGYDKKDFDNQNMEAWKDKGGWHHTGITWKQETDSKTGRPIPIKVKTVEEAVGLVLEGKVVEVDSPETAVTVISKLAEWANAEAKAAETEGRKPRDFDMCNISVAGTNMFCAEHIRDAEHPKGYDRIVMPQLAGEPVPGTAADREPRDKYNPKEVDGAEAFKTYLKGTGIKFEDDRVPAASLKATQNELVGSKVAKIINASYDPGEKPIFVSSDNYVVDGHHRWAAVVARDAADGRLGESMMNVVRVNSPISELLHISTAWSINFGIKQKAAVADQAKHTGIHHTP